MCVQTHSAILADACTALDSYPTTYETVITLDPSNYVTPSLKRTFDRFLNVHNLEVSQLLSRILCALQGDDEASGGRPMRAESVADEEEMSDDEDEDHVGGDLGSEEFESHGQTARIGRGFETAKGSSHDMGQQ